MTYGRLCRLETLGVEVGVRLLELLTFREKTPKRKQRVIDILRFIHSTLWPYMFGKTADSLEQANAVMPDADRYRSIDLDSIRSMTST